MIKIPAKNFLCPDGNEIEIAKCLEVNGCRLRSRCATLPYLNLIAFDREYKGISPSMAGTGPMQIYLRATVDYTIDPYERVWAAFGTSTHGKLSIHSYTRNVLSEEPLSDEEMKGIPDCLETEEGTDDEYIISDYKNFGSYKVAKCLGISIIKTDKPILDEEGNPVLLKSGKNKGAVKTKQETEVIIDPNNAELDAEKLQINRYRIFFEYYGFGISDMRLQVMVRDGGTYIAKSRGIDKNMYIIPIPFLDDKEVLSYYYNLNYEVKQAFEGNYRKCNAWESWDNRRCNGYCEVSDQCKQLLGWG